ncbi:MAG: hypothetical protein U1E78_09360 [Gammaproteobacteria bacterium]
MIFRVPAYALTSFRLRSSNFERTRRTDKQNNHLVKVGKRPSVKYKLVQR